MTILFFVLLFLSVYSYAIYPLLLFLLKPFFNVELSKGVETCPATLIISAHNEEAIIGKKIENSLELDFPENELEIIVVSDGSTDATDEIVRQYSNRNVVLISSDIRRGKTAGLNAALTKARGEIVVFTDADSMFPPDTLNKFSEFFGDNSVGLVTGSTSYMAEGEVGLGRSTGAYAKLEKKIKKLETSSGSCVGADGAIFSIRKNLYVPLRDDDINDLVIPLNVIRLGKRVVLREDLMCVEPPSLDEKGAFLRQARITNRTLRALFRSFDLLNFIKFRSFSFKLVSHKYIRLSTPIFMLALLPVNFVLLEKSSLFITFVGAQLSFYGFAILGSKIDLLRPFNHFVLVQAAILYGWYLYIKGENMVTWNPRN